MFFRSSFFPLFVSSTEFSPILLSDFNKIINFIFQSFSFPEIIFPFHVKEVSSFFYFVIFSIFNLSFTSPKFLSSFVVHYFDSKTSVWTLLSFLIIDLSLNSLFSKRLKKVVFPNSTFDSITKISSHLTFVNLSAETSLPEIHNDALLSSDSSSFFFFVSQLFVCFRNCRLFSLVKHLNSFFGFLVFVVFGYLYISLMFVPSFISELIKLYSRTGLRTVFSSILYPP